MMGKGTSLRSVFRKLFSARKTEVSRVEPVESVDFSEEPIPEVKEQILKPEQQPSELEPADVQEFSLLDTHSVSETVASQNLAAKRSWKTRLPGGRKKGTSLSEDVLDESVLTQRPIRLFMGYVPDVTEKDARFFAMGVAEKNVESEYISYLGVFRYGTGYAYEIQEGGHGHSYLTRIIKHFNQLPPNLHDAETAVFVATASRMVQIEKTADGGLVCIQLPEIYRVQETDWVKPEKKLKLLRDQNSGIMMVAGTYLGISLLVLAGAFLTRYVPRENPAGRVWYDTVSIQELPVSQWGSMIQETNNGHYIQSLRYNGKEWCRKTEMAETCGSKPSVPHVESHPGPIVTPNAASATSPASSASVASAVSPASAPVSASLVASGSAAPSNVHPLPPLPPMPKK